MQALKREREAAEQDQEKLALELHKATVWGDEIAQMVASLADFSNTSDSFAMAHGMRAVRLSEASLNKLSDHFHKVGATHMFLMLVVELLCIRGSPRCSDKSLTCTQSPCSARHVIACGLLLFNLRKYDLQ